jgi:hypothetical protein
MEMDAVGGVEALDVEISDIVEVTTITTTATTMVVVGIREAITTITTTMSDEVMFGNLMNSHHRETSAALSSWGPFSNKVCSKCF